MRLANTSPVSKGWENAWEIGHRKKILPTGVECHDGTKNSGCGQLITSYRQPQGMGFEQAFATFIKPSIDPESDAMQEHVRSCGRSAELRNLNKHDADKYKGGHFRTKENRSSWEKTCYLKASAVADAGEGYGPGQLAHGIHYPLFVLGKMPCDRGAAGKKNRYNKSMYGGSEGWKAEQLRRGQQGVSGDWATSTWSDWSMSTWGSPSRGWNAASAVADNAPDWSSWTGRAMQASAVADAGYPPATTWSSGCARGKGAGKGASNDGLQNHAFFADPAAIPWAD
jgi:hypothetical protein